MRQAFTIGIDAKGKSTIISGLDTPQDKQRTQFGSYREKGVPREFSEIILATSDGRWKRLDRAKTAAQIEGRKALEAALKASAKAEEEKKEK